jgi:hypothetical protein
LILSDKQHKEIACSPIKVFSSLPDSLPLPVSRQYEASIDEVCWLVCKKGYLQRELPCFTDKSVFQLFRVFCLLAELNESDPPTVSSSSKNNDGNPAARDKKIN